MPIRAKKQERINRSQVYDAILDAREREAMTRQREEEKKKKKEVTEKIVSCFKMFYSSCIPREEMEDIVKKFTVPREAAGIVKRLSMELEKRHIDSEKWLKLATKMFL